MKTLIILLLLCLSGVLGLSVPACDRQADVKGSKAVEVTITDKDRKLARLQFLSYCAACHGKYGRGDGPTGKTMIPKPRNWTDTGWQRSVTDERLYQVIRDGGARHGLSPLMAPNPQHGKNPGVLWALVELVRSFGD
jgi:mono/diheme cytochrome c family protein